MVFGFTEVYFPLTYLFPFAQHPFFDIHWVERMLLQQLPVQVKPNRARALRNIGLLVQDPLLLEDSEQLFEMRLGGVLVGRGLVLVPAIPQTKTVSALQ